MDKLSRRDFLKFGASTAGVILASGGAYGYLHNTKLKEPPHIDGRLIADLHTHPPNDLSEEELCSLLSSGLTGLAIANGSTGILSYDEAIGLPGTEEIDKGLFAQLTYQGSTGYFVRCQEVMSDFHLLAVGCKKRIENHPDARDSLREIKKQGGLAVLNHPYVSPREGEPLSQLIPYRLLPRESEPHLEELAEQADAVEIFNSQSINLLPAIAWMEVANERAEALSVRLGKRGIASSDSHRIIGPIRKSGIYIPDAQLNLEALFHHIEAGDYLVLKQYMSRIDFLSEFF